MQPDLAQVLIDWYGRGHRDLPWRNTRDPYPIWLSEVMLQQTQVATVLPYYDRFLAAFPTIAALAAATEQDVIKLWEGLGYYARCRNLHRAAKQIVAEHDGQFPATLEAALRLPGIGRSTAGAVLTFAFGQRHPILDGNVVRVLARLDALDDEVERMPVKARLWERSAELLETASDPAAFNQALMELGATLCTPRSPRCPACPWAALCASHATLSAEDRPRRRAKKPIPHHHIAVGLIWRDDHLLIQLRPAEGLLGGLWEFPGGKQEPREPLEATVAREIQEELGIDVEVGPRLTSVAHAYTHFRITLHAFHCRYLSGTPEPRASQAYKWVTVDQLDGYAFPKANRLVLDALRTGQRVLL